MIIEVVVDVIRKRNQFPAEDGITDEISPLTIVYGEGRPDYNKMRLGYEHTYRHLKKIG